MDIYFTVVSTANAPTGTYMLETRYIGSVSAYKEESNLPHHPSARPVRIRF
jgi:hypothetical protein